MLPRPLSFLMRGQLADTSTSFGSSMRPCNCLVASLHVPRTESSPSFSWMSDCDSAESIDCWSDNGRGISSGGTYLSIKIETATIVNARSVPTLTCKQEYQNLAFWFCTTWGAHGCTPNHMQFLPCTWGDRLGNLIEVLCFLCLPTNSHYQHKSLGWTILFAMEYTLYSTIWDLSIYLSTWTVSFSQESSLFHYTHIMLWLEAFNFSTPNIMVGLSPPRSFKKGLKRCLVHEESHVSVIMTL